MKKQLILIVFLVSTTSVFSQDADRQARQGELDRACELARQKALGPMRDDIYKECMAKGDDEATCKAEADGFDGARVGRGALFYDLPECQEAFEYQKGD
ncbi:MAG: hypothetical protein ACR2QG_03170 [Gammaproteobacteria bacterium]